MFDRIGCYLTGHDYGIRCEGGRMYLRCGTCGHASEGWSVSTRDLPADREHHATESGQQDLHRAEVEVALR